MNKIKVLIEMPLSPHSGAPAAQILRFKYKPKNVEYYPLYVEKLPKFCGKGIINPRIFYGLIRRSFDWIVPDLSTLFTMGFGTFINAKGYDIVHTMVWSFQLYNKPTIYERSGLPTYVLRYWYNINYNNLKLTFKIEKEILKRSAAIIAWTKWAKMLILKYYPSLNDEKIYIIPPPAPIYPINRRKNKDHVTILFLGDDFYRKGGDIALKIFKNLILKYKNNIKIIVKSNKIPYNYKSYFNKINNVKIIDHFINTLQLYKETDIFFLPTRADNYSMSLIEVNSLEIPAIVSDLLPLREISPFSIFCKINDEKAFYEALCFLIENEKERKIIGNKSKQFVEKKFDPLKISLELEKLYRSVIE
jgi:glycosyltransferase involved in cell wall biosynthesis